MESCAHWDGTEVTYSKPSDTVPAVSAGLGYYFNRFCGFEMKYLLPTKSTPFPSEIDRNWVLFTLNLRFPVPGMSRGSWSR